MNLILVHLPEQTCVFSIKPNTPPAIRAQLDIQDTAVITSKENSRWLRYIGAAPPTTEVSDLVVGHIRVSRHRDDTHNHAAVFRIKSHASAEMRARITSADTMDVAWLDLVGTIPSVNHL